MFHLPSQLSPNILGLVLAVSAKVDDLWLCVGVYGNVLSSGQIKKGDKATPQRTEFIETSKLLRNI